MAYDPSNTENRGFPKEIKKQKKTEPKQTKNKPKNQKQEKNKKKTREKQEKNKRQPQDREKINKHTANNMGKCSFFSRSFFVFLVILPCPVIFFGDFVSDFF